LRTRPDVCSRLPLADVTLEWLWLTLIRLGIVTVMARSLHDWQFAHTFDEDRRSFLERLRSFDEIAQELQSQVLITSYRGEKGTLGSVKGCLRPNFKIETSSKAFDEFFNGRSGYRAAYYVDPEEGVRTNESFLSRLVESLVAYALSHPAGQYIDEGTLRRSLALPSAKVWLDEDGFSFDHALRMDILVPEWGAAANDAVAAFGRNERPDPPEKEKAIWGVRAPAGCRLDVKGAFVATDGVEQIALDKRHRSKEIHEYGFS